MKMKQHHHKDKYKEFHRTDAELWDYKKFIIGVTFIFPFRVISLAVTVSIYLALVHLSTIGHDFSQPLMGWRRLLFRITNKIVPRIALACCGYITMSKKVLDDYDYSKWLGKDYNKPKFAVSTVSNHSAWTDLFVMLIRSGGVSFVSKASIKRAPLFGKVGIALNSIFFDRAGSKEEKQRIVDEISSRQKAIYAAEGNGVLLHIFPEGMTTNNTHLLPFKRGVFEALLPVRPLVVRYSSANFNPSHDVMPMHYHLVVLLSQFLNHIEVIEMPIFEPNRYLFEHHSKPNQEKWSVFADAVRE